MKLPPAFAEDKKKLNVIVETPVRSRNKFSYDEKTGLFKFSKTLAAGLSFPCDMGFIPGTKGEDGDPLDIFIFMDEMTYPGCFIECRLIGVIKARQKEKKEKWTRNDRFIGVPCEMKDLDHIQKISDINKNKLNEIVDFCEYYNAFEGVKFKMLEIAGRKEAQMLIEKQIVPPAFQSMA